MDDETYEVSVDGDVVTFDSTSDVEDFIKSEIESGADEDGFTVTRVTREDLDYEVSKEITVSVSD